MPQRRQSLDQRPCDTLTTRRWLPATCWLGLALLVVLTGCGNKTVTFRYPGEEVDFSLQGVETPALYIDTISDLRPPSQREGEGSVFKINYPADDNWELPVVELYRLALVQDLQQTNLVELVPMRSQADYTLSIDILSLGSRLERNVLTFLLPAAVGMGLGFAFGSDTEDGLKIGSVLAVAGILAIPVPTPNRAAAEVRMVLRDTANEVIWERSCLGEVDKRAYVAATSRADQTLVDKYLTKAVKRCNACLLGQLRQALIADSP